MRSRIRTLLTLTASIVVVLPLVWASPADAAPSLTTGFNIAKSTQPNVGPVTNFVFLPSTAGTMLAITKCGSVARGTINGGWVDVNWAPHDPVYCNGDRGLLGIDVDPVAPQTAYLLYDYVATDAKVYGRLSKVTANSATSPTSLTNEVILLDGLPSYSADVPGSADDSHTIGTVLVAPDRTLFVGVGDGSSYGGPDVSATLAQDRTSPRGKIFHITSDGSPAPGNPYGDSSNFWEQRVYAYGLRNPFRFSLAPTGQLLIGDVGWNTWEEIDIADVGGGQNFGWPCWEGPLTAAPNGYQSVGTCPSIRAHPPANLKGPQFWWDHSNPEGTGGNAAVGGVLAVGAPYGEYSGQYVFGDYAWNKLWSLPLSGAPRQLYGACPGDALGCGIGSPVAFRQGPNGDVFYADIVSNRIYELKYQPSTNQPPVAEASVDPAASRDLNTDFRFDASASYDPEGGAVTVNWTFGDGSGATGAVVTHRYTSHNDFTATATVTDKDGGESSFAVPVTTKHSLPTLTLTPNKSGSYAVGEPVTVTATAQDENGAPIPGSSIEWSPQLHHCPTGVETGQCHVHPQDQQTGITYSTTVPDHGDDMYLEFRATVTDGNGFSTTKSFNLPMDEHGITVTANVPGAIIAVNSGSGPAPVVARVVANSLNRISAPLTYNGATFLRWSDGSTDPVRQLTMPATDVTLTAIYSAPVVADGVFTPVQPYRLLDTRASATSSSALSAQSGVLTGGQELVVNLAGQPGAPAQPSAAMLNITVTDPVAAGFLRAYPCGSTPANSTVNFDQGQTAANLATVRVPADGRVCFWSMVDTNLVIDVAGWYSATGSPGGAEPGVAYQTVDPVRVLDSRRPDLAPGGTPGKFQAFQEVALTLAGKSGFPGDARAALLNLTVTEPDDAGYLRVYPCGEEQTVSNVNFVAGQTVANFAAVKVSAGGQVCFRASTSAHVVVDLAGWYAPGGGALLAAPDPVRVLDTRDPALAPSGVVGPLPAGGELTFQVAGYDGVPAGASSVVLNITATNTAADGYVAAYPCGSPSLVSNVNYRAGQVAAANLAVVKLPPDGRVCFTSFATTDLVVDLAGWYVG